MVNKCEVCGTEDVRGGKCSYCGHIHKVGGNRKGRSSKKDRFPNKDKRKEAW